MRCATSVNELTRRNVETIAKIERASNEHRTLGERAADRFAAVVGSWPFIIAQTALLSAWLALNLVAWSYHWDPYPFILLNLMLSFQAAYASPIIMMSQNRQARLAEGRNRLDLQINLLAEQELTLVLHMVRDLCEHLKVNTVSRSRAVEAFLADTNIQHVFERVERDLPSS